MANDLLRQLPAVDQWVSSAQGTALCAEYSRAEVVEVMRAHLTSARRRLRSGASELPAFGSDEYTAALRADLLARRQGSLKRVINATGIVIHTNLGRAPLAPAAIAAIERVAGGYSNLEYSLDTGSRGSRNAHAEELIRTLTGAEAALVVNNCAAAVMLALTALAGDGDVIVSRGELIEIGGSFRMPDVIAASGARMVEVGTTNRTTLRDYAAAVGEGSRVLLASHPSNYRIVGFTAKPALDELAALARERGLVLVQDLGSGSLVPLDVLGSSEPTVAQSLAQGVDLVTFSGDKLLGGPQAGLVAGGVELIERLKRHPLARAARIDKLSLAALTATLRLYLPPHDPRVEVPALRMIVEPRASVARRARRLVKQLADLATLTTELDDDESYAGGGALPMSALATCVVRLRVSGMSAAMLARRLREGDPPVIARIADDAVCLDLRTVAAPQELRELAAAIRQAVS